MIKITEKLGDIRLRKYGPKSLKINSFMATTAFEVSFKTNIVCLVYTYEESRGCKLFHLGKKYNISRSSHLIIPPGDYKLEASTPTDNLVIIPINNVLIEKTLEYCPDLKEIKEFKKKITLPFLVSSHNWLDQVISRIIFELGTDRYMIKGAIDFLEVEFLKELYFVRLKELGLHRHKVIPEVNETKRFPTPLQNAIRVLESSPLHNWGLNELAKEANSSVANLSRMFKKFLGHSPGKFIQLKKLEYAKVLLKEDFRGVSEIAHLLNYQSASAFIYAFRVQFGVTPTAFRSQA